MSTPLGVSSMPANKPRSARTEHRLPGDPGIWLFMILDMLIFAEMFCIYAWYRAKNADLFAASQHAVNPVYGLVYTLLLVTSSWCVAIAVTAARRSHHDTALRFLNWALGLGAGFVVIKLVEYALKLHSGLTPVTNDFFMFYFILTFVHLLHVCAGLGVLCYAYNRIRVLASSDDRSPMQMVETSAVYWHMVDLLWIFLFALFYLRG
jgi:nitric oxide reductase NorE protein